MKIVIAMLLALSATLTQAAELTLFDIPLGSSSRAQLQAAIEQAGGKLSSSTRDLDRYDVKAIPLPEVTALEVVYLNNEFVLAQYAFGKAGRQDERLRKMLTAKYGQPHGASDFDGQYVGDGKRRWRFDRQMELVYTKEFFGDRFLTYVSRPQQEKLNQLVKRQDSRAAQQQAAKLNSVF